MPVKPIPDGYHTITPYLIVRGGAADIDFYKKAFGATELFRMPGPDGRVMHAELRIGDSPIMLADACPEMGAVPPQPATRSADAMIHTYARIRMPMSGPSECVPNEGVGSRARQRSLSP